MQESGNVFEVEGEEEDNGFAGFTSLPGCVSGAEKSAMEPTIGMQAAALEIEVKHFIILVIYIISFNRKYTC